MSTTCEFNWLTRERLRMEVHRTIVDLTGRTQYDLDGILNDLTAQGVHTIDNLEANNDPDMFWAIVANHELLPAP